MEIRRATLRHAGVHVPEQIRYEAHRIDGRCDIWALGIILYELLTGKRPFHGQLASQLSDDILHREMRPPRQLDNNIPEALQRICLRCCAKDPQQRYATAADVASELQAWQQSTSATRKQTVSLVASLVVAGLCVLAAGWVRRCPVGLPPVRLG